MYGSVGVMTYEETHANVNDSNIKTEVDNWYKTNIQDAGYSDKVADVIYCNDRSYYSGTGYGNSGTDYGSNYRLYDNKSPILTCINKNDRFTVNDTILGNGALIYPVGLITADEVSMGGGKYSYSTSADNSSYYLYTGQDYLTMSPSDFMRGLPRVVQVFDTGRLSTISGGGNYGGMRPVLSLKSDVVLSGSGTMDDPYVVQ